jgi:hypothetical protein
MSMPLASSTNVRIDWIDQGQNALAYSAWANIIKLYMAVIYSNKLECLSMASLSSLV